MNRLRRVSSAAAMAVLLCGAMMRAQNGAALPKMAEHADPDWEVVTVKAGDPTALDASFGMNGRQFVVKRETLGTLFLLGYGMQQRQLINSPGWITTDRWDIVGVPDTPGKPSLKQLQSLTRKLLTQRFALVSHTEQREMDVYALTMTKGGGKMTKSTDDPSKGPQESDSASNGERTIKMQNASLDDLALLLKLYLDRPVVDHTGLAGRFNFQLKYMADETKVSTDPNAAPGLFTAIQEQLGLKLEPVKAPAPVLVIDKVERPSAN